MTQFSIQWILSLNQLSQKWGQVQTDLGFDIAEFQIPGQWLKYPVVGIGLDPGGGRQVRHGKQREVEANKFLSKLDAVLEYFTISATTDPEGSKQKTIGFTAPKE
jgi:hypothetical protein